MNEIYHSVKAPCPKIRLFSCLGLLPLPLTFCLILSSYSSPSSSVPSIFLPSLLSVFKKKKPSQIIPLGMTEAKQLVPPIVLFTHFSNCTCHIIFHCCLECLSLLRHNDTPKTRDCISLNFEFLLRSLAPDIEQLPNKCWWMNKHTVWTTKIQMQATAAAGQSPRPTQESLGSYK